MKSLQTIPTMILALIILVSLTITIPINAQEIVRDYGKFTGSFTLVKAETNVTKLSEIKLQTFKNGDTIYLNNYPSVKDFSMYFHFRGKPFDIGIAEYSRFGIYDYEFPYGLTLHVGTVFKRSNFLKTPGLKTIRLSGGEVTIQYIGDESFTDNLRIIGTEQIITFTIATNLPAPAGPIIPVSVPAAVVTVPTPIALSPQFSPVTPPVRIMPVAVPVAMPIKPTTIVKPTFESQVSLTKGKWIITNMTAPIQKRHEACFLMVGRKAVLIGGRGIKRPDIYDPITRTWTFGSIPPNEIHHMQCVAIGSKIWIVAAWTGNYPKELNAPFMYTYDVATDTWETKPPMPENRRRGSTAVVAVGNKIYVAFGNIGGHETMNHSISLPWLDEYNINTGVWKILPDANYPRDHTGGALIKDGRICIAGGRDGGIINWPLIFETECYNTKSKTWTIEANIPTGRAGSSYSASCSGELIVAGGEIFSTKKATKNFESFDGNKWTILPSLNIARHSTGLAVDCICNQIYIVSGSGKAGGVPELTSIETFFPNGVDKPCLA